MGFLVNLIAFRYLQSRHCQIASPLPRGLTCKIIPPGEISMAHLKTLVVLGFLVHFAAPALAARKDRRPPPAGSEAKEGAAGKEARERAAKKACLNDDPAKGVEILTDLYVDTNDPTYIFNQGRCYEQNNRCEEAIVRFREYLRKTAGGSESDRGDVQKHIEDCEVLLAKRGAATAGPQAAAGAEPASVVAPPAIQPRPGPSGDATPAAVVAAEPRGGSSPGAGLRAAGVATMVVGGAALIAGGGLNLKHNSMIHDLKGDYSGDSADSAQTYKTLSMVGYGVGAACLVGGAALYWLGWRAGKTVVGPGVVAGNAGVLLTGSL
jgi:hypothetical protein